jgi:hypothetical protein
LAERRAASDADWLRRRNTGKGTSMNEVNATPHTELLAELMNPNNPKNEREHAAVREIERLREVLAQPEQNVFKAAYIEAMIASNEAGFAGMTAAETIRELSRMVSEQLKPHTT